MHSNMLNPLSLHKGFLLHWLLAEFLYTCIHPHMSVQLVFLIKTRIQTQLFSTMRVNSEHLFRSLCLFYRLLLRQPSTATSNAEPGKPQKYPPPEKLPSQTIICDMEGVLLRNPSTFPYFMLVALEEGGFLRGLLLLILHPFISCMSFDVGLRVMVLVSFFGLRKESFRAGRAVLPKFFLEDVGLEGFEVLRRGGRRVCISSMPTVMVEYFAREYLDVEVVLGRELKVFGGFYTGLMREENAKTIQELLGNEVVVEAAIIGFRCSGRSLHHQQQLFGHCEEVYMVGEADKKSWHPLPRSDYPKPLIFHDGRIAFKPTPVSTLCVLLWLPFGFALAFARALSFLLLPYSLSIPLLAFLGTHCRLITSFPEAKAETTTTGHHSGSQLFISNHRTLLDPLCISAALGRPVTATTYSVSRISEWVSPIRTLRLTRNRDEDRRRMMAALAEEGDCLVVCPEGTTCREPYLLRFSPLFAEVSREVAPVALETAVSMFYGTSTSKHFKCLDPLYFLMNPCPCYRVEFMGRVATGSIGGRERSSYETANYLQREIGRLLGFECTSLTRKDKYLMLAGNDGR